MKLLVNLFYFRFTSLKDEYLEKRLAAAVEVTSQIRSLNKRDEHKKIVGILVAITELSRSKNVDHRMGAVFALAASVTRLGAEKATVYLDML